MLAADQTILKPQTEGEDNYGSVHTRLLVGEPITTVENDPSILLMTAPTIPPPTSSAQLPDQPLPPPSSILPSDSPSPSPTQTQLPSSSISPPSPPDAQPSVATASAIVRSAEESVQAGTETSQPSSFSQLKISAAPFLPAPNTTTGTRDGLAVTATVNGSEEVECHSYGVLEGGLDRDRAKG